MVKELLLIAKDDELGRKLQDLELKTADRAFYDAQSRVRNFAAKAAPGSRSG